MGLYEIHKKNRKDAKYADGLCSFCNKEITRLNANDFILSCDDHKQKAQEETTKFFKEYPDYTKWRNDVPEGRLKFK